MPITVTMPRLDKDMEQGVIAAWHVAEGGSVTEGMALFDIETDKAAVEIEAPATGTLHHILVEPGGSAPVDAPVAWIYAQDEVVGERPVAAPVPPRAEPNSSDAASPPTKTPRAEAGPPSAAPRPAPQSGRLLTTPAARTEAAARGIGLARLTGTGPSGRIQKSDVLRAAGSKATLHANAPIPAPISVPDETGPLSIIQSGRGNKVPMVMIHGFLSDASAWAAIEKPMARERPIYRIELPCHGQSPRQRLAGFTDLARTVRHAFDTLDLDRCHLVGHSLGGAVALALADTRPRSITSLTLIAPAGLGPQINGEAIAGLCRSTRSDSLGPWLRQLTGDPEAIGWSYVQAATAARSDPDLRAAQQAMAEVLFPDGVQAFDLSAALERLTGPARIVWGKRDRIIPWRHALHAPGRVSLNLFDRAGHMPQYEIPDDITALLAPLP